MGKRKATITLHALESLAAKGINQAELAKMYGLTESRISQILSDPESPERQAWDRGQANLHQSLKEKQLELALGGNAVMCIWLSKQYLGFADKREDKQQVDVNVAVQYIAAWGKSPQELAASPTAGSLPDPSTPSETPEDDEPDKQDQDSPDDGEVIDGTAIEDPAD